MAYEACLENGNANYRSWIEVDPAAAAAAEFSGAIPLSGKKYAQCVYSVNPSTISLSGLTLSGLTIDNTAVISGIELTNELLALISSDVETLKINIANGVIEPALARRIEVSGGITWLADAQPGTLLSASLWRAKQITEIGAVTDIQWADGNGNFDNAADSLSSLTYI